MSFSLAAPFRDRLSVVHQLDPRAKLVTTLAFILTVSLIPEGVWGAFALLFLILTLLAGLARLGLTYALRRSFVALPFVLAAVALPFTVPGRIVFRLPFVGWGASEAGLVRFATILLRSWIAVQAAMLLNATTRFPDLLWAMHALRVPQPLVSIVAFLHRYLFLLLGEASRMLRARAARSGRLPGTPRPAVVWQGRTAGSMVGNLFLRSLERSERVYDAMLARGYDGTSRTLQWFRWRTADTLALSLVLGGLAALLMLAHLR